MAGSSRNIGERLLQHPARWRGGEYRIPAWEKILQDQVELRDVLYVPHGPNLYQHFRSDPEIQRSVERVLDHFRCYWHAFTPYAHRHACRMEHSLATSMGKGRLIGSYRGAVLEGEEARALVSRYEEALGR